MNTVQVCAIFGALLFVWIATFQNLLAAKSEVPSEQCCYISGLEQLTTLKVATSNAADAVNWDNLAALSSLESPLDRQAGSLENQHQLLRSIEAFEDEFLQAESASDFTLMCSILETHFINLEKSLVVLGHSGGYMIGMRQIYGLMMDANMPQRAAACDDVIRNYLDESRWKAYWLRYLSAIVTTMQVDSLSVHRDEIPRGWHSLNTPEDYWRDLNREIQLDSSALSEQLDDAYCNAITELMHRLQTCICDWQPHKDIAEDAILPVQTMASALLVELENLYLVAGYTYMLRKFKVQDIALSADTLSCFDECFEVEVTDDAVKITPLSDLTSHPSVLRMYRKLAPKE